MSNVKKQMSYVKCYISNDKWQISNDKCQMSSEKCQVLNVKCQVSSVNCKVIILIQLVYHIHIGYESSLLSYTFSSSNWNSCSPFFTLVAWIVHVHVRWTWFVFKFKFILTQANLMFSIQSPVRLPEASRSCDKSIFSLSYFHSSSKKSLCTYTCPCSLSFPN